MKQDILVSIIITTKNEEKNIETCIQSINSQTFKNTQILIIDNNSTDKTKELALKYTKQVFTYGPERSAQRNFGVEKSLGKYILYLDADMILAPEVISECVSLCEENNFGALYIPEIITGLGFWIKVRAFERSFYDATVIDCVRFINKDLFNKVGGFNLSLTGPEDWDFDKKIRQIAKTGICQAHLLHNEWHFDTAKYLNKKDYYAKSMEKYISIWGKNDPDIKKQLGLPYRFFIVFIEKFKFIKLIKHPVLTFAMYYLRFRVGLVYLLNKKTSLFTKKNLCLFLLILWFLNIFPFLFNHRYYKAYTQFYGSIEATQDDLNSYFHTYSGYIDAYNQLLKIKKEQLEGKYPPQEILFTNLEFFHYLFGNYVMYPYDLTYKKDYLFTGINPPAKDVIEKERANFKLQIDLVDGVFTLKETSL